MRATIIAMVLLATFALAGCKKTPTGSGDQTRGASDITHPKDPPSEGRYWTKEECIAFIHDDLGLTDINLTPAANNGFTGTGKAPNGAIYKLKVSQKPGEVRCDYEYPAPTAPGQTATGSVSFGKK